MSDELGDLLTDGVQKEVRLQSVVDGFKEASSGLEGGVREIRGRLWKDVEIVPGSDD